MDLKMRKLELCLFFTLLLVVLYGGGSQRKMGGRRQGEEIRPCLSRILSAVGWGVPSTK